MNSRRIQALKNLAERGATEGERKAARKALEAQLNKARSSTNRVHFTSNPDRGDWFAADFLRRSQRVRDTQRRSWTWVGDFEPSRNDPPSGPLHGHRVESFFVDDMHPPKSWPEAVDVSEHPTKRARARLEVPTSAEMFSRFRESKPVTIRWRGHVWRTEGGTCEDNEAYPTRFYLTINTARLTRLD